MLGEDEARSNSTHMHSPWHTTILATTQQRGYNTLECRWWRTHRLRIPKNAIARVDHA